MYLIVSAQGMRPCRGTAGAEFLKKLQSRVSVSQETSNEIYIKIELSKWIAVT